MNDQAGGAPTAGDAVPQAVRVLVSYAHDDAVHEDRVREFWWFLRANGVDARLDLLAGERRQDWTEWMSREVRDAAYGWIDARGLFVGLQFVRDRVTKEPADDESGWMLDFCVREGLLFEKGGYYYNRFQLIPSLVIDKESIDRATDILDRAMTMAEARSGIGG